MNLYSLIVYSSKITNSSLVSLKGSTDLKSLSENSPHDEILHICCFEKTNFETTNPRGTFNYKMHYQGKSDEVCLPSQVVSSSKRSFECILKAKVYMKYI